MIYVVGSGGGGTGLPTDKAILHITAPTGSKITIQKYVDSEWVNVTTLASSKGHTNAGDANLADWYYSCGNGTWGVIATKSGVSTTRVTATVSGTKQYDLLAIANTYVINAGNVDGSFTRVINSSYTEASKSGSAYYIHQVNGTYSIGGWVSLEIPALDRDYDYLVFEFNSSAFADPTYRVYCGLTEGASQFNCGNVLKSSYKTGSQSSAFKLTLDISSIESLTGKYVSIWFTPGDNSYSNCYVKNVYLK